ncbi:Aste57867_2124 [Aphanomyces stellatus]|uniref:Aste57867_2124 protein n=1 Tax=Aphanomyces stellatus TaxID=120398 RepID=A0A485K9E2_9STRA|nr:hypothetical protein As57867_002119 [Aphanomyces stellatus]VFT79327.1 Aste57867_2124 [Aphanomyces stellatus]
MMHSTNVAHVQKAGPKVIVVIHAFAKVIDVVILVAFAQHGRQLLSLSRLTCSCAMGLASTYGKTSNLLWNNGHAVCMATHQHGGMKIFQFSFYGFTLVTERKRTKKSCYCGTIFQEFHAKVQAVARELNVLLEKVPPRFTWTCQPADVAWNKPFKSQLRRFWINSLMAQLEAHRCAADESVPFRMEPPGRSTIVKWINIAWVNLSESIIVNGFRKTKLLFDDMEAPDVDSADTTDDGLVHMLAQTMGHLHVVNDCMVSSRMSVFD